MFIADLKSAAAIRTTPGAIVAATIGTITMTATITMVALGMDMVIAGNQLELN